MRFSSASRLNDSRHDYTAPCSPSVFDHHISRHRNFTDLISSTPIYTYLPNTFLPVEFSESGLVAALFSARSREFSPRSVDSADRRARHYDALDSFLTPGFRSLRRIGSG